MSPLVRRDDIDKVEPLVVNERFGLPGKGGSHGKMEGAVVTLRATRGMTAQWLQRLVDCQLARNSALGHTEMPSCPLLPNASARVTETNTGFAVTIRSGDPSTAEHVLERARSLVGGR